MKKTFFVVIGFLITTASFSQTANTELIGSAGESFSNTTYLLDWSMGETITETYSTNGYLLTQGFQQTTYQITLVENHSTEIEIKVFPNPTSDLITVSIPAYDGTNGDIIITDINGKILKKKKITVSNEEINFSNYVSGIYFLIVKQENEKIKSFKIIKN